MSLDLNTPCIETRLSKTTDGYGQIKINGRHLLAHRLVFTIVHGEPAPGDVVLHLCGNPGCVNPHHLKAGTHKDNADDRSAHGRTALGERHGNAKLTLTQVQDMRLRLAAGERGRHIARSLGVSESLVSLVKRGKKWAAS